MTKYELVAHLADLSVIMDFHEKLGTIKNPFIMAEFRSAHDELAVLLEKEDETRKSAEDRHGSEERTDRKGGVHRRG